MLHNQLSNGTIVSIVRTLPMQSPNPQDYCPPMLDTIGYVFPDFQLTTQACFTYIENEMSDTGPLFSGTSATYTAVMQRYEYMNASVEHLLHFEDSSGKPGKQLLRCVRKELSKSFEFSIIPAA